MLPPNRVRICCCGGIGPSLFHLHTSTNVKRDRWAAMSWIYVNETVWSLEIRLKEKTKKKQLSNRIRFGWTIFKINIKWPNDKWAHTGNHVLILFIFENRVETTHMRDAREQAKSFCSPIFNGLSNHLLRIQNINIYLLACFQCYTIIRATTYISLYIFYTSCNVSNTRIPIMAHWHEHERSLNSLFLASPRRN